MQSFSKRFLIIYSNERKIGEKRKGIVFNEANVKVKMLAVIKKVYTLYIFIMYFEEKGKTFRLK